MTRSVKPLVTNHGRVLNGTYFRCFDFSQTGIAGLPTIPPERVGLHGEYDHYGLAKRVQAGLLKRFNRDVATRLVIQQRGSAILLSGHVSTWALAEELVQFILAIEGATQVELHQLQVIEGQRLTALSA